MGATVTADRVEERLRDQLVRDARKPSRRTVDGDSILINPSGTAAGMAYALEQMTGEPWDAILSRIIESLPYTGEHIPKLRTVDPDEDERILLQIQQHFAAMPYGGLCHFAYADTSRDRLSLEQIANNPGHHDDPTHDERPDD